MQFEYKLFNEKSMTMVRNIWFLSSLVPSKRENLALLSLFIFQFLNHKIHNYVLLEIILNFTIQKLKNKLPQKISKVSKAKFSRFGVTREVKNQIFRTKDAANLMSATL